MAIKHKGFLSGNAIKLLAAVFMIADHIGAIFYPIMDYDVTLAFRSIGRLSMPLFAFMIAEGCRYTKNRKNYFLSLFAMGVICSAVFYVALGQLYLSIMTTFAISVLLISSYDGMINAVKKQDGRIFTSLVCFVAIIFGTVALEVLLYEAGILLCDTRGYLDYGVIGTLLPLLAYISKNRSLWLRLIPFALGVAGMSLLCSFDKQTINAMVEFAPGCESLIKTYFTPAINVGGIPIHWFSLGSLVFIAFYNGERGKLNLKYFFYLFYPLHLLLLQGIATVVALLIY